MLRNPRSFFDVDSALYCLCDQPTTLLQAFEKDFKLMSFKTHQKERLLASWAGLPKEIQKDPKVVNKSKGARKSSNLPVCICKSLFNRRTKIAGSYRLVTRYRTLNRMPDGERWLQVMCNSHTVTYWPSTRPSIKKQVHPVEDTKI